MGRAISSHRVKSIFNGSDAKESAADSFLSYRSEKTMFVPAREDSRIAAFSRGTREPEVTKMSDAVWIRFPMGWLFPPLREKMKTIIPIATRGKCTSVEVPFVPADITPNALHTEARWRMQLLYLFAPRSASSAAA